MGAKKDIAVCRICNKSYSIKNSVRVYGETPSDHGCCNAQCYTKHVTMKAKDVERNYLVMQIGCIECGVTSYPIKVCETLDEAREVEKNHPSTWESEGGDGFVMIIDLQDCITVG